MNIPLDMPRQPTESTCGPTCLYAIYRFYGMEYPLDRLIEEIMPDEEGGTVSVHLALHALDRGFDAATYSYNLRIFDPTWRELSQEKLIEKLRLRIPLLKDSKLAETHAAYIEFLEKGGVLHFDDLTPFLLRNLIQQGHPILTGLSATYLYRTMRELPSGTEDDVAGLPVGHFIVLNGVREDTGEVVLSDPYRDNPFSPDGSYPVDTHRFINAVMLGIVTYDANLLVISPRTQ